MGLSASNSLLIFVWILFDSCGSFSYGGNSSYYTHWCWLLTGFFRGFLVKFDVFNLQSSWKVCIDNFVIFIRCMVLNCPFLVSFKSLIVDLQPDVVLFVWILGRRLVSRSTCPSQGGVPSEISSCISINSSLLKLASRWHRLLIVA